MIFCNYCKTSKSSDNFHRCTASSTGFTTYCKPCKKQYSSVYYQKNKQRQKEYATLYVAKHRKVRTEYTREWRKNNPDRVKLINQTSHNKRQTDVQYRLTKSLRASINRYLRGKQKSATKLLGCDIKTFKIYIEAKFQSEMNWDNYGEWQIDHIFPLSKADLTNDQDLQRVCHYTNLQPLWAADNIRKYNKIVEG